MTSKIEDIVLTQALQEKLTITTTVKPTIQEQETPIFLCDMGYGLPKEPRPRKEKLLAIARQLVNFLEWQVQKRNAAHSNSSNQHRARVQIVDCPDQVTAHALRDRMHQLWNTNKGTLSLPFPAHVSWTTTSLDCSGHPEAIYLSPDADRVIDATKPPLRVVMIGLVIDRRQIQVNRSRNRAETMSVPTVRWPLEDIVNVDAHEPLNVDCVLEGMQQWYWNYITDQSSKAFRDAVVQAVEHHAQRHPERVRHKVK